MAHSESESKSQTEVKSQVEPAKSPAPEGTTRFNLPGSLVLIGGTVIGVALIVYAIVFYYSNLTQ